MMAILYYIGSYFIGNVLTGYLFVKIFHHSNLQISGSGNPGARNAGRLYGKKAFIVTFLGDAFKGSLIIIIGRLLDLTEVEQLIGLTLAVIGHIKPILFRFKGGKGISTFIGGVITFEPFVIPAIIIVFLLVYPFTKSFTLSGLASLCFIPFAIYFFQNAISPIWVLALLIIIIILAHAENLKKRIKHT